MLPEYNPVTLKRKTNILRERIIAEEVTVCILIKEEFILLRKVLLCSSPCKKFFSVICNIFYCWSDIFLFHD